MRRRWRRDLQIRAQLIELALADPFDCQQIFDAPERAALMAEIHDGWGSLGADAGNLLSFLDVRNVQVQRMRRRLLRLRHDRKRTNGKKNRDNRGVFHGTRCPRAITRSYLHRRSYIRRYAHLCLTLPISLRIVFRHFAKKRGLFGDLRAVSD
jgi:hypothetical protein